MDSLNSFASLTNLPNDIDFATYFNHLRRRKMRIDVVFVLETPDGDEIEVFAHQFILAMRSPHFADTLYGSDRNNEDSFRRIRLRRVNPKAFEVMIRYCYGCTPGLDGTEEACALFKVASEFKVYSLMKLCRTSLKSIKVEPRNVFDMLELADYMKDDSLRDKCYTLLEEKTREVIASYDLRDITKDMVHITLQLPKLSLNSEYELITWVFEWAIAKIEKGDSGCTNAREFLENFLLVMNFLALAFEEFATLCKDYPDFFSLDEIALICLNIAHPGTREMPYFYVKDLLQVKRYTGSKK